MMQLSAAPVIVSLVVIMQSCSASKHYTETTLGYGKSVLMDMCQFVGVKYIRNPDSPECSYIACWNRTPYNMPCPPGLVVHPLFFWGGSYPCTESDTDNKCTYVKDFMLDSLSNTQKSYKQGPRDGSPERFQSRQKVAPRISAGNLQESVYGTAGVYKGDYSGSHGYEVRDSNYIQTAPGYHSSARGYHGYRAFQPKVVPKRQLFDTFPDGSSRRSFRINRSTPDYLPANSGSGSGSGPTTEGGIRTAKQSRPTSGETPTIALTLDGVFPVTKSKPEETLELADSASSGSSATARAPTAAMTSEV